jgi:hypothetical protein
VELCIKHYVFIILRVDGEWLSSRLGRFIPRERSTGMHLGAHCGEEKYLLLCRESNIAPRSFTSAVNLRIYIITVDKPCTAMLIYENQQGYLWLCVCVTLVQCSFGR